MYTKYSPYNNVNALTLARMHQWMRSSSFEIGEQYHPPAFGRRVILHPDFSGNRTAFTDASSPESTHSLIVIWRRFGLVCPASTVFTDWPTQIILVMRAHWIFIGRFRPVLIGQTIYSRVHMGLSWWVESIGVIKFFHMVRRAHWPMRPSDSIGIHSNAP